jgi:mRNA interferase MazF
MCDFTGFKAPEMVKYRPVVVVSRQLNARHNLCTVVPLSTREPNPVCDYHHLMDVDSMPGKLKKKASWAKCDMLFTVALARLDRLKGPKKNGKRTYLTGVATDIDMVAIQRGILCGLSLSHLTSHISVPDNEVVPASPASEPTPDAV